MYLINHVNVARVEMVEKRVIFSIFMNSVKFEGRLLIYVFEVMFCRGLVRFLLFRNCGTFLVGNLKKFNYLTIVWRIYNYYCVAVSPLFKVLYKVNTSKKINSDREE